MITSWCAGYMCSLLLAQGHLEVCGEAVDGHDAVEKAKRLKPDLIIMDVSMPNLNGLEATRQIRNILPQTKVVMLSQDESSEMIRQAFIADARGYVVKSSASEDLLTALEKANHNESSSQTEEVMATSAYANAAEILQRSPASELALDERMEFEARFMLAAIVDSSDDAIVSKNLDGIIKSWNAAAQRIFGFTAEEAIGQPITIIIPRELRDEETQILKRIKAGERIDHYETVRTTKMGLRRYVSLTISPVRNLKGQVIAASKIVRDITERKQSEETALSALLLQAQDEERRRIARELHDSVGQLLAAVGMNSARLASESRNLSPGAARAVMENSALVQQVTDEVRTISHLLHPPLLDEVGLASALRWYIDGFAERSKIPVKPPEMGRMPRDHEMALFRIIQECLTNIHRHSRSQTALVRITAQAKQIRLEVKDEGRGISPEIQSTMMAGNFPGVRLRGMRERVKQLGGRLDIQSSGSGTSVVAVLPIENKQGRGGSEFGALTNPSA